MTPFDNNGWLWATWALLAALLVTLVVCDALARLAHLPRSSLYVMAGAGLAWAALYGPALQTGLLPNVWVGVVNSQWDTRAVQAALGLLAELALGAMVFSLAQQARVQWLHANPWILVSFLLDAAIALALAFWLVSAMGWPTEFAWALAGLLCVTTPAQTLLVVRATGARGQVTQRLVLNAVMGSCLMAMLASAAWAQNALAQEGAWPHVATSMVATLCVGALLGALVGLALASPVLERMAPHTGGLVPGLLACLAALLALQTQASVLLTMVVAGLVFAARRQPLATLPLGANALSANSPAVGPWLSFASLVLFVTLGVLQVWSLPIGARTADIGRQHLPDLQPQLLLLAAGGVLVLRLAIKVVAWLPFSRLSGLGIKKSLCLVLAGASVSGVPTLLWLGLKLPEANSAANSALALYLPWTLFALELSGPLLTALALRLAKETFTAADTSYDSLPARDSHARHEPAAT